MPRREIEKNGSGNDELSDSKSRVFKIMEQRLEKKRRRASRGKLISYIILLILVIILMILLKRYGSSM